MTGWHVFRRESYQSRSVVLLMVLAVCGGPWFAPDAKAAPGLARHGTISLMNISAERAKEFLSRLRLGTASRLPGGNTLLITAEPGELQKAMAVLNLVDSRIEFEVRDLGPASARPLPSSERIASAVSGASVGTFANPPQGKGKMRAIVDTHNGSIVVIAPVLLLENIQRVVESSSEALKQREPVVHPTKETGNLASPVSGEPQASSLASGVAPQTSAASQTTQAAPAAAGSGIISGAKLDVGSGRLTEPQTSPFNLQAAADESGRITLSKQTQLRLEEIRERAEALQAQRRSLSQSGAKPEPAAPADPQPAGGKPAPEPSDAPAAEATPLATPSTPAAVESASSQPGRLVPPDSVPVAQARTEPQPQTAPAAASPVTPPAQGAVSSAPPAEASNEEETKELTLPERLPVIMLLDLVGKHLGLSYVYNSEDLKGEVSLKLNGNLTGTIKVKDLYPLLEQTLKACNLVATRHKGNIVTIVPSSRYADIDPRLVDPGEAAVEIGDTIIIRQFQIKHVDTSVAKTLLDNMRIGLDVTGIPEKHMLIVTAYACRMDRIERLLQVIDQPGEPRKFEFRQLRYTMAKTLTEKVKAMAEQMLESVSVTVAESDPLAGQSARQPGESDVAYRTRMAQLRVQQTALRAQQAVQKQALGQDTKPTVFLDADERTNRVLMIGVEQQLAVVKQLVEALDVEQQDLRALQLYRMQHVDAEEVAMKLQELGIISKLPGTSASARYSQQGTSRITPQLPGQPRPATPTMPEIQVPPTTEVTEKGLVEEPQVVVVEATNSLLVNATAEQHAKIAHIIEYVDSETLTNEIPYKLYPLKSSSPNHMAEVLQSLIQETVEQQKEGGKIEKMVVSKDEKIKIVPDPNTCSLIVYANKKNQEWIANLIEQLDKRRPQVLIDVTLVEVTKSDVFTYDLNLIRSAPNLAATSAVSGIKPGADSVGKFVQTGTDGLSAFYGDQQIQALVQAMQSKNYGRVLAKPKLLVNDNENGKIQTTDTTYVEVSSAIPVTSGAAGTQTNLVQTSVNFNPYKAGITLEITPHISEGELLRLDIVMTRSDFLKTSATKPPDVRENQVDTKATLPNGGTVILGGMLKMNQTKGGAKVPLLGDLPLVGGLFRSISNEDTQSKLYVFVKAEIIRPAEMAESMKDLESLSQRNREAFEKHELEFQGYEDWPGIKPKKISPPKVLDAQ